MNLLAFLVCVVVLGFVARFMRMACKWVDTVIIIICAILVLVLPIALWISEDFWSALGLGIVDLIICSIFAWIAGFTKEVKVEHGRETYTIKCEHCDFNDVTILDETYEYCEYECPRCGTKYRMVYTNDGTGKAFTGKI